MKNMAERVGVCERDVAIPNVYSDLRIISRNRNDLGLPIFASVFVHLPAFADLSISMALEMALAGVFLQALRHDNCR